MLHVIGECNSCFLNRPQTETVKRRLGLQGSQAAEAQQWDFLCSADCVQRCREIERDGKSSGSGGGFWGLHFIESRLYRFLQPYLYPAFNPWSPTLSALGIRGISGTSHLLWFSHKLTFSCLCGVWATSLWLRGNKMWLDWGKYINC